MDNSEIRKEIQEEVRKAEKILVGIGAEWKRGDEDREEQIRRASKALRGLLEGKDAFIISTLTLGEMEDRGFEKEHMVTPLDVSLTEEQWNGYTGWLAGTLNRTTVLLELGEGFAHPSLIRWPFERTAAINRKARLYRVHKTFYQITEELKEKAAAVKADSVGFMEGFGKEEHGSDQ